MAEMLVSMAIFITLMAGVAALFVGSVDTVRQGYRSMEAFETGRSTLTVLEQDLKGAFTARELGQYYQFYGSPVGFMIVGAMDGGRLGRVSYVVHETAGRSEFTSNLAEQLGRVEFANDLTGIRGRLVNQGIALGLSFEQARDIVLGWFPGPANTVADIPVTIRTGSLLRYAEPGASNLNALPLPSGMPWPYIDPVNPNLDEAPSPEGLGMYALLVEAINPNPGSSGLDMRVLAQSMPGGALTGLRPQGIQEMLDARKRDVWLRLLAGQNLPGVTGFWNDPNVTGDDRPFPEDYIVADSIVVEALIGEQWPDGTEANALYHPSYFFYANSEQEYSPFFNALPNIQPPLGLSRLAASQFNDPGNHPLASMLSHPQYMHALRTGLDPLGNNISPAEALIRFDRTITTINGGTRLAADSLGSPMLPQLPYIVRPGFWIMKSATRPGGADFRRWFGQAIDIPSAFNRVIEPSMTPNPSQV